METYPRPRKVSAVFDNPSTGDAFRYTIQYRPIQGQNELSVCSASAPGYHAWTDEPLRPRRGRLRRIRWNDLPPNVQRLVREDIAEV